MAALLGALRGMLLLRFLLFILARGPPSTGCPSQGGAELPQFLEEALNRSLASAAVGPSQEYPRPICQPRGKIPAPADGEEVARFWNRPHTRPRHGGPDVPPLQPRSRAVGPTESQGCGPIRPRRLHVPRAVRPAPHHSRSRPPPRDPLSLLWPALAIALQKLLFLIAIVVLNNQSRTFLEEFTAG